MHKKIPGTNSAYLTLLTYRVLFLNIKYLMAKPFFSFLFICFNTRWGVVWNTKLFEEFITLQALLKELDYTNGGAIKSFLIDHQVYFNGES